MKTGDKNEIEIDLKKLFFYLLRRFGIIGLSVVVCAVLAFVGTCFLITPQYKSTSTIYIMSQDENNPLTNSSLTVSTTVTSDVAVLIKSRTVAEQVIEIGNLNISATQLINMITVNNPDETRMIKVSVVSQNPAMSKVIVDLIDEITAQKTVELMGVNVSIIDYGNIPTEPTSPNLKKNTAIGALLGAVISIGLITVTFALDDKIRTADDVETYLGVNNLAVIPIDEGRRRKKSKERLN